MSIDEKIKQELETEAQIIDDILMDKQGIFALAAEPFKNGLSVWMILIGIVTLMVTGVMLWTGYEFYIAADLDGRVFWGVWFIISASAQIALKQWTWMEINRSSLLREVKRVEIAIVKLASIVNK